MVRLGEGGLRLGLVGGLISGLLLAVAGMPGGPAPLALVALAPLFATATAPGRRVRHALAGGLLAGGIFYGAQLGSLAATPWDVAPLLTAAVVGLLASGFAAAAALLAWLARRLGPGSALALAPALWAGLDLAGGRPPFEIAWLELGSLLAGSPWLLGLAPLGGAPLLGLWAGVTSALAVLGLRGLRDGARPPLPALALALAPLLPLVVPEPSPPARRAAPGEGFAVAVVQPNVSSRDRHAPARFDANLRTLLELSRRGLADTPAAAPPDLLVWPETAWDATAARGGALFVGTIAHTLDTPLLTGARLRSAGDRRRNAVVLASREGEVRVVGEKRHPVPGYEAAPSGPVSRALARRGWWPGRIPAGEAPASLELRDAQGLPLRVGVLVCFDLHDAALVRRLRRGGAELLLTLANESDVGPVVAAANERLARLRAAENGVPVVRVANTGRSVWIDAHGRVHHALAPERAASGIASLTAMGAPSFYARHGPAPALALALPLTVLALRRPAFRAPRRARPGGRVPPDPRRIP